MLSSFSTAREWRMVPRSLASVIGERAEVRGTATDRPPGRGNLRQRARCLRPGHPAFGGGEDLRRVLRFDGREAELEGVYGKSALTWRGCDPSLSGRLSLQMWNGESVRSQSRFEIIRQDRLAGVRSGTVSRSDSLSDCHLASAVPMPMPCLCRRSASAVVLRCHPGRT